MSVSICNTKTYPQDVSNGNQWSHQYIGRVSTFTRDIIQALSIWSNVELILELESSPSLDRGGYLSCQQDSDKTDTPMG